MNLVPFIGVNAPKLYHPEGTEQQTCGILCYVLGRQLAKGQTSRHADREFIALASLIPLVKQPNLLSESWQPPPLPQLSDLTYNQLALYSAIIDYLVQFNFTLAHCFDLGFKDGRHPRYRLDREY